MYNGKKGLHIFKAHIDRLESDGKLAWPFFSLDYDFITKYFGSQAADWAIKQKDKEIKDMLTRLEVISPIKDLILKKEIDLQPLGSEL